MTAPAPAKSDKTNAYIATFLGFVAFICATVIALMFAAPDSTNSAFVIQVLLGQFAISVPIFISAIINGRNSEKLTDVLNGKGDQKLQTNLKEFTHSPEFEDLIHTILDARKDDNGSVTERTSPVRERANGID